MASRARIATATCLVASGLLLGGAGGALALADPGADGNDGVTGRSQHDAKAGSDSDASVDDPSEQESSAVQGGEPGDDDDADRPTRTATRTSEPTDSPEPPGDCEKGDDRCGANGWWPWWPWPAPKARPPGEAPRSDGGGVASQVPVGRPDPPPLMQLPPELRPPELRPPAEPAEPAGPLPAVPGLPAAGAPPVAAIAVPVVAPVAAPVIAAPPVAAGGGPVLNAPAPRAPVPRAPRGVEAERPAPRQPPPGAPRSGSDPATSYRAGYTDHLRAASLSQLVAFAVPGLAGILVLTGAGGLVGYRQAKAGHAMRTGSATRFVN